MYVNRTSLINVPDRKQGGQIGHRKTKNGEVKAPENGCWKHPADPNKPMRETGCFTCPENDCNHNTSRPYYKRKLADK